MKDKLIELIGTVESQAQLLESQVKLNNYDDTTNKVLLSIKEKLERGVLGLSAIKNEMETSTKELMPRTYKVLIYLKGTSDPISHRNIKNCYTKEGFYCIWQQDKEIGINRVLKYPMADIFRVEEYIKEDIT